MKKLVQLVVVIVAVASAVSAQAQSIGGSNASISHRGNDYGVRDARRIQEIQTGTVEDVREVVISRRSNAGQYVGAGVGGTLGALAGRAVAKKGNKRAAATALLGALGALAGQKVGEAMAREEHRSLEVIVALDSGRVVGITQEIDADALALQPGDRVRLIKGSVTRVVRMYQQSRY